MIFENVCQETKAKLTQTLQKLKEAKEEGEQIRADCQAMIKRYQVETNLVSNSLFDTNIMMGSKVWGKLVGNIYVCHSVCFQESEEMKSISLNHELKQKVSELQKHTKSIATQDEVWDL